MIVLQSAVLPEINVLDRFDSTMHETNINGYSTKNCYGGSDFK